MQIGLTTQASQPELQLWMAAPDGAQYAIRALSLQTARKPNSVLDDHSSTRHITAPL